MYYLSKKKLVIVAGVIVATSILYLSWRANVGNKSSGTEGIPVRGPEKPVVTNIQEKLPYPEVERDPFASPLKPSEELQILEKSLIEVKEDIGMTLTGIVLRGKSSSAVVNREIVRVGDIIEGKKVIAIEKDRVVLSDGKKKYILYLRR
ncbi:MAG: hypothetical protein P9M03_01230 [Candidatus Theseobacter exili]|nr:hypothetical protein [Candidatus Theseobacter exili]